MGYKEKLLQTFLGLKMIDFTALNRGFNPGRFIVADEDERNILKMFNDRS